MLACKTLIILDINQDPLEGYSRVSYHIVDDIKWGSRRKERLVLNENTVDPSDDDIY